MNQQDTNTQTIVIEDLAAQSTDEIKGGPNPKVKRTVVLQSSATGAEAEQQQLTILGSASNHNETVVADEIQKDELSDLEAPNAAVVKGGEKLPPPTTPISAPPPTRR
jgi:hypothetical protein